MIAKISFPPSSSPPVSALDASKFKRKSNVEQFKQNSREMAKLEEVEANLGSNNLEAVRQSIIKAKDSVRRRQKLVQLADSSELGRRTVAEYQADPIASDIEDENRIYKAEARAKKRPARPAPFVKPRSRPELQDAVQTTTVPQQHPGLCSLCWKPGRWKMNVCRGTGSRII